MKQMNPRDSFMLIDFADTASSFHDSPLPNTPENLSRWIHNPGEVKPGNIMSTVIKPGTVSDQDIADIVAFLESQTISIEKPAER
mgnify:CR=1 FL=1